LPRAEGDLTAAPAVKPALPAPADTQREDARTDGVGPVADAAPSAPEKSPPRFDAAYLHNPKPEYPRLARRLGEQGTVLLNVFVDANGVPQKIELSTSSGSPRLDQAARQTVQRWKFVPARQGDRPIGAWIVVPIRFVLES
jgi:protein TonB